jgi:hypothetical protein
MLENWQPKRLVKMIPFVVALVGNRRSGKSTLQSWILENVLANEFDLIISFAGSVSCSPELREFFVKRGQTNMMFDSMSIPFLDKLIEQQEEIKENRLGRRRVLLILDDAQLDKNEELYLGTFCTRARHFDTSIMQASVSYTGISKNFRRSLDCLMLFSVGMHSDRKLLLQEFSRNPKLSHYAMMDLEKYQCLVQEKDFKSELFYYRLELDSPEQVLQNPTAQFEDKNENLEQNESLSENKPLDDNLCALDESQNTALVDESDPL